MTYDSIYMKYPKQANPLKHKTDSCKELGKKKRVCLEQRECVLILGVRNYPFKLTMSRAGWLTVKKIVCSSRGF